MAAPADLAHSLQLAFGEIGPDIGEATAEEREHENGQNVYCPYCGHCAQHSEALPEGLWLYLRRWAMREVILPAFRQMNTDLERRFQSHRTQSRGPISVSFAFRAEDLSLPPSPIAGPETPDMRVVELTCCHNRIKVLDGWRDTIFCPVCGKKAALQ